MLKIHLQETEMLAGVFLKKHKIINMGYYKHVEIDLQSTAKAYSTYNTVRILQVY